MKSYIKDNFWQTTTILIATIVIWYKILNQYFLGEAYYYMDRHQDFFSRSSFFPYIKINGIYNLDNFARIMFDILPPFFKDKIELYLLTELVIIFFLYISLYSIMKYLTNKKIALIATLLFAANYVGSYQMFAIGNYQYFVQRVPCIIPALFSLKYLHDYLKTNNKKKLYTSFLLYLLALFMGHFVTFFMPLLFFYPIIHQLFKTKKKKIFSQYFKNFAISLFFVISTFLVTSQSPQAPTRSMTEFIRNDRFISKTLYQVPTVVLPNSWIILLAQYWPLGKVKTPYVEVMPTLLIIIFAIYTLGYLLLKKSESKTLYVASIFAMIVSMFLYAYSNRGPNPLVNFGQSRQYFVASLFSSLSLTILLEKLFSKIRIGKVILVLFVALTLIYNTHLIWKEIDRFQYQSVAMKRYVLYVKSVSNSFSENSVIIAPSYLLWPSVMINEYYGSSNLDFILMNKDLEKNIEGIDKENAFVFDYDYERKGNNPFNKNDGFVVDRTKDFRDGKKVIPIN